MKYRRVFATAFVAWSFLATQSARAQGIVQLSISGSGSACPGPTYNYGYSFSGAGSFTITGQQWTTTNGNIVGGIDTDPSVSIIWPSSATSGVVELTLLDTTDNDQLTAALPVAIVSSPNTANPSIVGAPANDPNYLAPGASVTFSVAAIPNVNKYYWTFPSCFSPNTTTTSAPKVTAATTGTCSGTVSVKGYNNSCSFFSGSTSLAITRIPPISSIIGPENFCTPGPAAYSVPIASGISSYTWGTSATGWTINTAPGLGDTMTLSRSSTGATTGTISVYGTVTGVGNTNTVTKNVTISTAVPSIPASLSYTCTCNICTPSCSLICAGVNVSFSAGASSGATSYQWAQNGKLVFPGNTSQSLRFPTQGLRHGPQIIQVRAINSCGQSASRSLTIYVSDPSTDKICSRIPQ
jgi:hypothetical protein